MVTKVKIVYNRLMEVLKELKEDRQVISFTNDIEFESWIKVEHQKSLGIWIRFFKKDSGVESIAYKQALEIALCYGWIDSHLRKFDDKSWLVKFTPRRSKSVWSKRNREIVAQLIADKRMQPAGLKEIEAAKADGRWDKAYAGQSEAKVPQDFLDLLETNKQAKENYEKLTKIQKYSIYYQLQDAKRPETREKRIFKFLTKLQEGSKF